MSSNKKWLKVVIFADTPILETIQIIEAGGLGIALVTDNQKRLLGTVTDGDVRRGILRGVQLTQAVEAVVNRSPVTASTSDSREAILERMKSRWRHRIPLVDEDGQILDLLVFEEMVQGPAVRDNWVVLMAGGLGSRLGSLTADCPKPMLPLGNKPILETILQNFLDYGFKNFYLSVNYRAEMIQSHFGNGSKWGANIRYLEEKEPLGTAGSVSLLPEPPSLPIIVMNGDVLTKVNFLQLLDFHSEQDAQATMAVREYDFQVPYGVVKIEDESIHSIDEKPIQKFFVNGGIYVIDPEVQKSIPKGQRLDMPELFRTLHQKRKKTVAFPIREYWLDIGRVDDFERAKGEFSGTFSGDREG